MQSCASNRLNVLHICCTIGIEAHSQSRSLSNANRDWPLSPCDSSDTSSGTLALSTFAHNNVVEGAEESKQEASKYDMFEYVLPDFMHK